MATKLIKLADGTLVEAEVEPGEAQQISGGAADKVKASLDEIQPIVVKVCESLGETWQAVGDQLDIEKMEVELGLGFEGEGNLFITRAKASANLVLTLSLTKKERAAQ